MARSPNVFTDPAGAKTAYSWVLNHNEEQENSRRRNIESGAPTGTVGLIRQQTDEAPAVLDWRGTILEKAQLDEFLEWYALSREQTIYLTDFAGDWVEGQITGFDRTRVRCVWNARGAPINPHHYWRYSMQFTVYRFIAGSDADAGLVA